MDRKDKDKPEDRSQDKVEGEGSYSASKDYNQRTENFVNSGKAGQAAERAKPKDSQEKQELERAEREGKQHAKGEDPALKDPSKVSHEGHQHAANDDQHGGKKR